ncbi:MAG: TolC family protein [Tannerella sp.]|jgi:outer membrane protein TolC|nr:TolC family protein [Tannerella sp.]
MKRFVIIFVIGFAALPAVSAQDSLDYYLEAAAKNNPAVMAAFHAYEAALQKIPQAGAYEDPRLELGFFPAPMELVDGRQIAQFQLMQMFPWFGAKKAARTEARHMAGMAYEQFREARDNLFPEICGQWYVLNRLQQRFKNNRENIALLKQLESLALRKYSSGGDASGGGATPSGKAPDVMPADAGSAGSAMSMGGALSTSGSQPSTLNVQPSGGMAGSMPSSSSSGGLSEILRIQLEMAELESDSASILSEMIAEKARFNALLNRPAESEITVPDTFMLIPFRLAIDGAMQLAAEQNPMPGMLREEALAYRAKEEMSRKMGYPMIGIGLQYMLIGRKNGMAEMGGAPDAGMNGRDMVMPMLSVSIPVYRSSYRAARKEAQFQQQAALAKYNEALNNLEAELYRFRYEMDDAERKVLLYRKQAGLARTACDLLVQEFISDKSDLSSILQVQQQLSDFRLKESEAIAGYNTAVAAVRKIISSKNVEP